MHSWSAGKTALVLAGKNQYVAKITSIEEEERWLTLMLWKDGANEPEEKNKEQATARET